MKKRVNLTIKAYLIRGAFYVLLLLAVCVIPFALAQRNTTRHSLAMPKAAGNVAAAGTLASTWAGPIRMTPQLKPGAVEPNLPYDVRPLPPQAPKFPFSSVRNPGTLRKTVAVAPKQVFGVPRASSDPTGGCGLLVGSTMTIGFPPNNFTQLASNIVNYTFANSLTAPNDYAVFQMHNPWDSTIVVDSITANGHTFATFTPAQLAGFPFSDYRVIILNWDDHFLTDFLSDYTAAIPVLEAYVNAGGVVWVQGSLQGSPGDSFPFPFGGQANYDLQPVNRIVDFASPMVAGVPDPINGNFASHADDSGLPAAAHVVVAAIDPAGPPTLYELFPGGGGCTPTPTPTPTATPSCTPVVVNGVVDTVDPTQTDRLFRDLIASTCAAPKVCPGLLGDGLPRHYDSYTFTNTTGATQCVTVDVDAMTCTGVNFIFGVAYLGSFNPADLCENYLADSGSSPNPTGQFSFDLADGQTVVLVVNEVDPNAGCVGYSMTISGLCGGGTPTPTVTVTPTPTVTVTPTPGRPMPTPRPRGTPRPRPSP